MIHVSVENRFEETNGGGTIVMTAICISKIIFRFS